MFYEWLLRAQIQKVQKDTDGLTVFFLLLVSLCIKAESKHVVEIDPRVFEEERENEEEKRE